jgi:hypothetical protein
MPQFPRSSTDEKNIIKHLGVAASDMRHKGDEGDLGGYNRASQRDDTEPVDTASARLSVLDYTMGPK